LDQPQSADGSLTALSVVDYLEHLPGGVNHIIRKMGDNNPLDNTPEFLVPPHHYFFMGDNRDNSSDSRTDKVGFVPEENLVGKAQFLFFSLDDGAHFWEFWRWPWVVRWSRMFTKIN
jgi:signal peptidase I